MFSSTEENDMTWDDLSVAAPGEERDALWRSLEQDLVEAAALRRAGRGFVPASRPADVARALGRDRRRAGPLRRPGS